MAAGTKLQVTFDTMSGSKTWSYSYAKANPTSENVKSLASTMITNGAIYKYAPLRLTSAKTVTTSENEIDIS